LGEEGKEKGEGGKIELVFGEIDQPAVHPIGAPVPWGSEDFLEGGKRKKGHASWAAGRSDVRILGVGVFCLGRRKKREKRSVSPFAAVEGGRFSGRQRPLRTGGIAAIWLRLKGGEKGGVTGFELFVSSKQSMLVNRQRKKEGMGGRRAKRGKGKESE